MLKGFIVEEKPFDAQSKSLNVVMGAVCLFVGAMFFLPGLFLLKNVIIQIFIARTFPDGIFVFATTIILAIGVILILLAFKFSLGTIKDQSLSTPMLVFASSFFILMSTMMFITTFIFKIGTGGHNPGRGIGGGFAAGIIGLWVAFKRKKGKWL